MQTNKLSHLERQKRKLIDAFELKTHHFTREKKRDMRSGYVMGLNDMIELYNATKKDPNFEWGNGDMQVGV